MATKLEKHRWLNTGTNGSGTPCSGTRLYNHVGGWVCGWVGVGCRWGIDGCGMWVGMGCVGVCGWV